MAIKGNIKPVICLNKVDLVAVEETRSLSNPYEALGFPVFKTSALNGEGLVEFKEAMLNRISAVVGQSGVGKSTLLNGIEPDLGLRTR